MQYSLIRDIKNDYYLESSKDSFLHVIEPVQKINYIKNPLMQGSSAFGLPDGFLLFQTSGSNASLRRDSSETMSPIYMDYYRINTTATNTAMYYLLDTITLFGELVCSVMLRTAADTVVTLRTNYTSNYMEKSYQIKANKWTRFDIPATGPLYSFGFKVVAKTIIDVAHWQVEQGTTLTTPIHGFMGEGYEWLEYPHKSSSIRYESVHNGGLIRSFNDFGFLMTEITGLGAPDLEADTVGLVGKLNKLLQNINVKDRQVSIGYRVYSKTLEQLIQKHSDASKSLISINKPKTFIFSSDCYNLNALQFTGVVTEGLSWEFNNFHGEELGIDIDLLSPLFASNDVVHRELSTVLSSTSNGLFLVQESGINKSNTAPAYTQIDTVHVGANKQIYIAVYDGSLSKVYLFDGQYWTEICKTSTNDHVTALHQDGKYLYVATQTRSTLIGISPYFGTSGNGIARINLFSKAVQNIGVITATTAPQSGSPPVPHIKAFATDSIGNLYCGGHFSSVTHNAVTVTSTKVIRYFTSNSWSKLTTLTDIGTSSGYVNSLFFDKTEELLYIGGDFRNATGVPFFGDANNPYVFAVWNAVSGVYVLPRPDFPLITISGSPSLPGYINKVIKFEERIYIGGTFDITVRAGVSSDTILSIGVLNSDIGLDSASNVTGQITNIGGYGLTNDNGDSASIADMTVHNGQLIMVGYFDRIININTGEMTVANGAAAIYNNSIHPFYPISEITKTVFGHNLDIVENVSNSQTELIFGKRLFSASNIILPQINLITLPKLTISDEIDIVVSGTINKITRISNITTRGHIYIDHQFDTEESVIFRFNNGRLKVLSSLTGDITYKVSTGSSPSNFYLDSGDNVIYLYFTSTATAKVHMRYRLKSLDGTVLLNKNS